jgi:hypothetical protein
MVNRTLQDGLDGFIHELSGGLAEPMKAGEQKLLELGHYNGAVTVLGILEDLLLSDAGGQAKVAQVQALLEEAQAWARSSLGLLRKYTEDDAQLKADFGKPGPGREPGYGE